MRSRRPAFTLIELLVVMAVIVLMISLIVPAASNFGKATALTTAGNTLANLAALARQNSIAKSTMTALLFLGDQGGESLPGDDYRQYFYRAVTVLEFEQVSLGTGREQRPGFWKQIHRWEVLPTGIIADYSDPIECSFTAVGTSPRFPFSSVNPPIQFRGRQVKDGTGYAARIFMPSGSLQNPEEPAQIRLVEGIFADDRVIYTRPGEKLPQADQRAPANFYDIAIVGTTGMAKVSRP